MNGRRLLAAVTITAGSALTALGLAEHQFFQQTVGQAELRTVDYRMRSAADAQPEDSGITLLLFDSVSVQGWPWEQPFPRGMLADFVDGAAAAGASVIGLDVFLGRRFPELNEIDHGDERLRAAIERAGNVVLVGPSEGPPNARRLVPPDPYFAEVAAAIATADLPTPFETIREAPLVTRTVDGLMPGFALATFAIARGIDLDSLMRAAERTGRLGLPGLPDAWAAVPVQGSNALPIRFAGPPSRPSYSGDADGGEVIEERRAFPAYSGAAVQMLLQFNAMDAVRGWMSDRIVLIGSGYHDSERFRTPFYDEVRSTGEIYGWTYGVEVHASMLHNLLTGSYYTPLPMAARLLLLFGVAGAVAAACFVSGAKSGVAVALSGIALSWLGAQLLFARADLILPVVAPALAGFFALAGSTSYISLVEGREKRRIRGAFGKYVAPGVVDALVADPSLLKLGGERRPLTILFSDLAGFTSMSETLDAQRLVAVLNGYLDEMAEIVIDEQGTLDKYIGDAIMALFGAPAPLEDHPLRGCRTALRMQHRLAELNREWAAEGLRPLFMRIGINSGTPVVGNIGGHARFDYTALGDSVNLAARLEPACKTYGVATMIGDETRQGAGDGIVVRELDMLAVYGKAHPVRVYELLALAGEVDAGTAEMVEQYERGLELFRARDFELAATYFEAALQVVPDDGPSRLYLGRCREYLLNPPPLDWDFVERRMVK
jgi:class 3 adenylate cyclase/CHASE2 domain-containing sensor protein